MRWNKLGNRARRPHELAAARDQERYQTELKRYEKAVRKLGGDPAKKQSQQLAKKKAAKVKNHTSMARGADGEEAVNLFNKVVTVEGHSLVGKYDYFFILTYIPDLQWCRVAPLIQQGKFGCDTNSNILLISHFPGWKNSIFHKHAKEKNRMERGASISLPSCLHSFA